LPSFAIISLQNVGKGWDFGAKPSPFLHIYGGKMQEVEIRREKGIGRIAKKEKADELVKQGHVQIINGQYFYKA